MLPKEQAATVLKDQGYRFENQALSVGRNITWKVERENKHFIFKTSTSPDGAHRIENEASFLKEIQLANPPPALYFPKLIQAGSSDGHPWLLREYLEGQLLGSKGQLNKDISRRETTAIVDLMLFLQTRQLNLPPLTVTDTSMYAPGDTRERALQAATIHARDVRGINPQPLIEKVAAAKYLPQKALALSDIGPGHIFLLPDGRLAPIDFEWVNNNYPVHYDIALTFCRTYARFPENPEIALEILRTYLANQQLSSPEETVEHLGGLLALRTIGELRDVSLSRLPGPHFEDLTKLVLDLR